MNKRKAHDAELMSVQKGTFSRWDAGTGELFPVSSICLESHVNGTTSENYSVKV